MKIMEWLNKSEEFMFWNRCFNLRRDPEFRNLVLNEYHSSKWLRVDNYGDQYHGEMVYLIKEFGGEVGFFSEVIFTLFRLFFADDRGLVPYVEWGADHLYYEPNGVNGENNVFLYYFEPVSEVKDIRDASYVVEASYDHIHELQDYFDTHGYDVSELYQNSLSLMIRKYLRYNQKTKEYLEKEFDSLIGTKKSLAVHFRGTDFRRQYNNHPVFVTIEEEIEKVHELIEKKGYEVIFLATDEQKAVEIFRHEFGDMVKTYSDTWRAAEGDESVAYSHADRENHHYLLGLEVIRDQYSLTRCDGLVCGVSNLTLVARMMRQAWYSQEYEDLVIVDNGICVNDKAFCNATH